MRAGRRYIRGKLRALGVADIDRAELRIPGYFHFPFHGLMQNGLALVVLQFAKRIERLRKMYRLAVSRAGGEALRRGGRAGSGEVCRAFAPRGPRHSGRNERRS